MDRKYINLVLQILYYTPVSPDCPFKKLPMILQYQNDITFFQFLLKDAYFDLMLRHAWKLWRLQFKYI